MPRRLPAALLLLMLSWPAVAPAGTAGTKDQGVTLPLLKQLLPAPFLSASGRLSCLNLPNEFICRNSDVSGRVVSDRLIRALQLTCENNLLGEHNFLTSSGCCSLMNVAFADPADTARMVTAKSVIIAGTFRSAMDMHGTYQVFFLIAENAKTLSADQADPSVAPAQASTIFMMCQPPELDALARRLGRELCVQSTLVANLSMTGPALEATARVPIPGSPRDTACDDPTTIACRENPEHSDAHLKTIACARNNYWAWWVGKQHNPFYYGIQAPP